MKLAIQKVVFSLIVLSAAISYGAELSEDADNTTEWLQDRTRPSMFVTATPQEGLRSLSDLRKGIQSGHAKQLWEELHAQVDEYLTQPVVTPMQLKEGKRVLGNRSYTVVARAANRILDMAMVGMVTEEQRYVDSALAQIMALFDEEQWPEWSDQAHLNKGLNADLRHGQLVMPVALAYDWLYTQLTPEQRKNIIEGLDRYAIKPYKAGFEAKEQWSRRRSNWMTVVLGGFGIAGMALGGDHPESEVLVNNSLDQMLAYLDIIGPDGEFNESVQYAGSMSYVIRYLLALKYSGVKEGNPFDDERITKFYRWYMQMTFPPGRVAGFGDPGADMPPVVVPAAAVAGATQDPLLQWFYEQYNHKMLASHRNRSLELLYYDASLKAQSPQGILPLAKAYQNQGKLVSSRSSWDPVSTPSVVYGKAGREAFHGHADWGQLCLDGYGERLVVDLGSPPGYPNGNYQFYYNYQQFGHNIFVIGENDTGGVSVKAKGHNGKFKWTKFDEERGAAWAIDLSGVYGENTDVTRTVVHLLPRVAVVLDQAVVPEQQPISLRWHLAKESVPDASGTFGFVAGRARLAGKMVRLDGEGRFIASNHAYEEPYNKHRLGTVFKQRHEPYIELKVEDNTCTVLSLFAVQESATEEATWENISDKAWVINTTEGRVEVQVTQTMLKVEGPQGKVWKVPLSSRE